MNSLIESAFQGSLLRYILSRDDEYVLKELSISCASLCKWAGMVNGLDIQSGGGLRKLKKKEKTGTIISEWTTRILSNEFTVVLHENFR